MGTDPPTPARLRLRDLPLAARLVLSAFLLSVGLGYGAALVQLHMKDASGGSVLPTADDAVRKFHGPTGERPKSKMQQLLEADESVPFGGTGSMAAAFTTKSDGWKDAVRDRADTSRGSKGRRALGVAPAELKQAEEALRKERDTERRVLLDWVANGASKTCYTKDNYCFPEDLNGQPIDDAYLVKDADGKVVEPRAVKIQSIINDRCATCHTGGGDKGPAQFGLTKYDELQKYVKVEEAQAISVEKLSQSTHVHLLGFAMLYGLTGLIFAFTSFPGVIRAVIAPLPLVAQVAEIGCWWLARYDPLFAHAVVYTGAVVAAGVGLQIVLSLASLYGKGGKAVLLLLLVAAGLGAWGLNLKYDFAGDINRHLEQKKAGPSAAEK
jgi:hypothetical protein